MFLFKTEYFNKNNIIKGLTTATLLSAFIYFDYFDLEFKIVNTIFALIALYFLLTISRPALFYSGFFTGIFWCYWMSISLQYYNLTYIAPLILLGIGLVYGIIFYCFALINKVTFRIVVIFLFLFISPFGFNWLKLELIFINSYISTTKLAFFLALFSIYLLIKLKRAKILFFIPLLFIIDMGGGKYIDTTQAKIYMPQMYINQHKKWDKEYFNELNNKNFEVIETAIKENNDLVILPETAFPVALNRSEILNKLLLEYSNYIDIVVGALYVENNNIYNASYLYSQNNLQIAKKVVLVPFGEEIPLPEFLTNLINKLVYDGASDFSKAEKPTDFIIKGEKYRNAICYEGTTDKIFKDLDKDTRYMIMISNNAWFTPSIEPTLQHLLLKYYSKKYSITIFHVANGSKNRIYRP